MADALARSPLEGHAFAALPHFRVSERPVGSLVQVAAFPGRMDAVDGALRSADIPPLPAPGASAATADTTILDVGPGRALVLSGTVGLAGCLQAALDVEDGTVTDLSHARVHLVAQGERAAWVLSKGVAVDLHEDAFPVGRTAVTEIDHVGLVLRRAAPEAFDLLPYRGYARALVEWLERAGRRDTL